VSNFVLLILHSLGMFQGYLKLNTWFVCGVKNKIWMALTSDIYLVKLNSTRSNLEVCIINNLPTRVKVFPKRREMTLIKLEVVFYLKIVILNCSSQEFRKIFIGIWIYQSCRCYMWQFLILSFSCIRWWMSLNIGKKLKFARDRILECFFGVILIVFQPEFGYCREWLPKVGSLLVVLDDVYDIYGSLDELELFTRVVDRSLSH